MDWLPFHLTFIWLIGSHSNYRHRIQPYTRSMSMVRENFSRSFLDKLSGFASICSNCRRVIGLITVRKVPLFSWKKTVHWSLTMSSLRLVTGRKIDSQWSNQSFTLVFRLHGKQLFTMNRDIIGFVNSKNVPKKKPAILLTREERVWSMKVPASKGRYYAYILVSLVSNCGVLFCIQRSHW